MWGRAAGGSKYGNRKVEVDGIVFDSKKEAVRFTHLQILEKAGEIKNLRTQVRFPLVVNGEKIGSYVADFVYHDHSTEIVEDTKSEITRKNPVYRIKKKLMRALYGIEIEET